MLFRVNFNRALIISFLWHLLCFFMFTIIIVPSGTGQRRLSRISFLGSILDDSSFKREFKVFGSGRQKRQDKVFLLSEKAAESQRRKINFDNDYFLRVKPYSSSIDELLVVEKKLPVEKEENLAVGPKKEASGVEGDARGRAILFKPPLTGIKVFGSGELEKDTVAPYYKIKLELVIAADGNVKSVENLQTSGYPELDLAAIRYVKKWKFEPLSPDRPQYDQGGMVLLELKPEPQITQSSG